MSVNYNNTMDDALVNSISEKERVDKIKCVVVGDGGSGKTSLLTVYAKGEFPEDYVPTVFDNYSAEIMINDKSYVLMLWDTAGQEEYDRLRPLSYDNVDVVVICYDVTAQTSFDNVTVRWAPEASHFCPDVPLILVGCKTDLRTNEKNKERSDTTLSMMSIGSNRKRAISAMYRNRIITTADGERLAKNIKAAGFIECSAKLGENVKEVFALASDRALNEGTESNLFGCCNLF